MSTVALAVALRRVLASRTFKHIMVPITLVSTLIVAFTIVYRIMDPEKHFEVSEEQRKKPWFSSFYISSMALSGAMGDASPRTIPGRAVFLTETLLGWTIIMLMGDLISS